MYQPFSNAVLIEANPEQTSLQHQLGCIEDAGVIQDHEAAELADHFWREMYRTAFRVWSDPNWSPHGLPLDVKASQALFRGMDGWYLHRWNRAFLIAAVSVKRLTDSEGESMAQEKLSWATHWPEQFQYSNRYPPDANRVTERNFIDKYSPTYNGCYENQFFRKSNGYRFRARTAKPSPWDPQDLAQATAGLAEYYYLQLYNVAYKVHADSGWGPNGFRYPGDRTEEVKAVFRGMNGWYVHRWSRSLGVDTVSVVELSDHEAAAVFKREGWKMAREHSGRPSRGVILRRNACDRYSPTYDTRCC